MLGAIVRWLLNQERCVIEGCPRAKLKADGTCFRHVIGPIGQVTELSRDGVCSYPIAGARMRPS